MGVHNFSDVLAHVGHDMECTTYGREEVVNVAIECLTCCEVMIDFDIDVKPDVVKSILHDASLKQKECGGRVL